MIEVTSKCYLHKSEKSEVFRKKHNLKVCSTLTTIIGLPGEVLWVAVPSALTGWYDHEWTKDSQRMSSAGAVDVSENGRDEVTTWFLALKEVAFVTVPAPYLPDLCVESFGGLRTNWQWLAPPEGGEEKWRNCFFPRVLNKSDDILKCFVVLHAKNTTHSASGLDFHR